MRKSGHSRESVCHSTPAHSAVAQAPPIWAIAIVPARPAWRARAIAGAVIVEIVVRATTASAAAAPSTARRHQRDHDRDDGDGAEAALEAVHRSPPRSLATAASLSAACATPPASVPSARYVAKSPKSRVRASVSLQQEPGCPRPLDRHGRRAESPLPSRTPRSSSGAFVLAALPSRMSREYRRPLGLPPG